MFYKPFQFVIFANKQEFDHNNKNQKLCIAQAHKKKIEL